jgi:hypothetical protein
MTACAPEFPPRRSLMTNTSRRRCTLPSYKVMIDDNYHYMDEDSRWQYGIFETVEEAIAACRCYVDKCLHESHEPGMTAGALFQRYTLFREDPYIVVFDGTDPNATFSGWDYAKERSRAMCAESQSM